MSNQRNPIDEFESLFRRAEREPYNYAQVPISTVAIIVDTDQTYAEKLQYDLLDFMPRLETVTTWRLIDGSRYKNVNDLLQIVNEQKTDLIVTYRNLQEKTFIPQHSLGVYLDVLTQATSIPILLLPGTVTDPPAMYKRNSRRVMVVTDHINGDHRLINYGARVCTNGGSMWFCHVEDDAVFNRYMQAIAKISEIDTDQATELIGHQLKKDAEDFIETCIAELQANGPRLDYHGDVTLGHHLSHYQNLINNHDIELVVINTKEDGQLAMHGIAYSLSVELFDTMILLL